MFPVLQIGPLALPVPQFSMLLAFWFGLSLSESFAKKRQYPAEVVFNLAFTGLVAGVLAGRLGYILQSPAVFLQNPSNIVSLNTGLFDPFFGLAGCAISVLIYGQRNKLNFWTTLDIYTPFFATLAIGIAFAHIGSGEAFGAETSLPWSIELWGARRHPSQFYELAFAIMILVAAGSASKKAFAEGNLFLLFTCLTAGARLFLEAFRGDSSLIIGGFRSAQVLAWLILAAALWILDFKNNHRKQAETVVQNG